MRFLTTGAAALATLFLALVTTGATSSGGSSGAASTADSAPEVHRIAMIGDEDGFRFEPSSIEANPGDRLVFELKSGPPHNVAFWPDSVPSGAAEPLGEAISDPMAELAGPLLNDIGATYEIRLDGFPSGRYPFYCMPHLALGMSGELIIEDGASEPSAP